MKNTFLIFLFINLNFFSQKKNNIQFFEIKDDILKNVLIEFIDKRKNNHEKFTKYGYIEMRLKYLNNTALTDEIKKKYRIVDQYYRPVLNKGGLPKYYTFIKDKLVFLYDPLYINKDHLNSKKNQKKIDKLIKNYLPKPIKIKLKDDTGKVIAIDKNFRDEVYNLHGGITLIIYGDNTYKIEKYPY